MDEYISKQKVLDYLNGYLHSLGEGGADTLIFDRGQRRALINSIQDISAVKAADVQPAKQWISVKDRQPQENGFYLTYYSKQIHVSQWFISANWYNEHGGNVTNNVEYWQPLPEPPKDGDTK